MAVTTDDLIASAECIKCIPVGMQGPVIIYLLQQIAGNTMTWQELLEATDAACLKCIPAGSQIEVMNYLLDQILGNGGGPSVPCANLEGAGDPT